MSDYTIAEREQCQDWMEGYEGFGEMSSYTAALDAEQVALTWRTMPPHTGGRGSYGHRHRDQEEIYLVISGELTFKVGDDVFKAGPKTAVRVASDAFRSVHNDRDEPTDVVICSIKATAGESETDKQDDFWPED